MSIEILIDCSASVMIFFDSIKNILQKIKEVNLLKVNTITINFYNNDQVLYKMNIKDLDELTREKIYFVCNRPSGYSLLPCLSVLNEETKELIIMSDFYEPKLNKDIETNAKLFFVDMANDQNNMSKFLEDVKDQDNIIGTTEKDFIFYLDKQPLYKKLKEELNNTQKIEKKLKM